MGIARSQLVSSEVRDSNRQADRSGVTLRLVTQPAEFQLNPIGEGCFSSPATLEMSTLEERHSSECVLFDVGTIQQRESPVTRRQRQRWRRTWLPHAPQPALGVH